MSARAARAAAALLPEPLTFSLQIEKIVANGLGLGFYQGKAVFVPFAAPGDQMQVAVTRSGAQHYFARCVQLQQGGDERVDPGCSVYTQCGGCQLRHLSLATQRQVKRAILRETLDRFPQLREVELAPFPEQLQQADGYRCRAGCKVRWVNGRLLLGFFQANSHKVADLSAGCPVLEERLNALLPSLRLVLPQLSVRERLPQVDLVSGEEGVGMVCHLLAPLSKADRRLLQEWASAQGVVQLWLQQGRKEGLQPVLQQEELFYHAAGFRLQFAPADFIQAHRQGNRYLIEQVLRWAGEGEVAWDLFCGMGNFSVPLASRFRHLLAVEGYAAVLQRTQYNLQSMGAASFRLLALDLFAEQSLLRLQQEAPADLLLLDPPREGALAVVKWLQQQALRKLLYISCNPATFARDAAILCHGGWRLLFVQPVDLFPQTAHLELLAYFER
ncbi:23S rRNA (uracil(1939)-C(5))-methyltransferase RlmD [Candidatus Magnetaquicoccus inordinatus]|uniref:23S rRNA (uracil(1939)-C(5))-methyltransferase RlmD n=1 Tax=Candidatus Magnetaquicoccus inordinatus TaxID=2496818 RepID=UPI00187D5ED5|nr:23S rRNA (uracil(1939)-C(5))-methyltransferase RlmD [Candidatus Magnetaquicoccus inordinatus]